MEIVEEQGEDLKAVFCDSQKAKAIHLLTKPKH
jgi:hypothetical protein